MANCNIELSELLPNDVYFVVAASGGQYANEGDISFIIPTFVGWKTRLFRSGIPQYLTDPGDGDSYFDYTSITAEFTLSVALGLGEKIICQAYKPS